LERAEVDVLETTHVDRRHRRSGRMLAETERRHAADRTEMMPDPMRVEGVRRELRLAGLEPHALPRHEPQQVSLAAAMRAVAVDDLGNLPFDVVRDLSAVTASRVHHRHAPRRPSSAPPSSNSRIALPRSIRYFPTSGVKA